jgi:hypothetical protein
MICATSRIGQEACDLLIADIFPRGTHPPNKASLSQRRPRGHQLATHLPLTIYARVASRLTHPTGASSPTCNRADGELIPLYILHIPHCQIIHGGAARQTHVHRSTSTIQRSLASWRNLKDKRELAADKQRHSDPRQAFNCFLFVPARFHCNFLFQNSEWPHSEITAPLRLTRDR